jgi:hypothetical protein
MSTETKDKSGGGIFTKMISTVKSVFKTDNDETATMEISSPYNFQHVDHVRPDPRSSTGFSVLYLFLLLIQALLL